MAVPTVMGSPIQQDMAGSGQDMFKGAKKLFIQQEFAAVEMCSIEAKNRYRLSEATGENKEGTPFLYISEESNCLERICCSVNRTLTLRVHDGPSADATPILFFHKPFHLQSCCCCRPEFQVYGPGFVPATVSGGDRLGTVKDPCRICWMDQQIYGPNGEPQDLRFTTDGSPWQCGLWCCPCCVGVEFKVKKDGNEVAKVEKLPMDLMELCCNTNRFMVDFGSISDDVEKKLLLASAMLLDLEYFEQNKNNN
jgi:hypothetical protein